MLHYLTQPPLRVCLVRCQAPVADRLPTQESHVAYGSKGAKENFGCPDVCERIGAERASLRHPARLFSPSSRTDRVFAIRLSLPSAFSLSRKHVIHHRAGFRIFPFGAHDWGASADSFLSQNLQNSLNLARTLKRD